MYNKLLGSSMDREKLSMTIKGVGGFIVTGVVAVAASAFGITGIEGDLNTIVTSIVEITEAVGVIISSATMAFGLLRKLVNLFKR